jgi:hypothetical protein
MIRLLLGIEKKIKNADFFCRKTNGAYKKGVAILKYRGDCFSGLWVDFLKAKIQGYN